MDLIMLTLRSVAYAITEPSLVFVLLLLGIMFYIKNRKLVVMQKLIIGESLNSPLELTLSQIVLGIVAGAIASLILSGIGIVFSERSGIEYVFLISIFFMFIKPRFVCFSYSAATLGAISILVGLFTTGEGAFLDVDILMLMTFVGVLHIVEALLVIIDGHRGTLPVFTNKKGKVLGGYALNRNWILPVAMLIAYSSIDMSTIAGDTIPTPAGWPLLYSPGITDNLASLLLLMIPFFGVVGYSAVTFTREKKKKSRMSGAFILTFGVLLCLVAQLAKFGTVGQIFVVIFAPVAHEAMIRIQKYLEDKREPLYVSDENGLAVLEVVPNSIAFQKGIRAGDKILTVNNKNINTEGEIYKIIRENFNQVSLKVRKAKGEECEISFKAKNNKRLGLLLVPRFVSPDKATKFEEEKFTEVLDKIKAKKENED